MDTETFHQLRFKVKKGQEILNDLRELRDKKEALKSKPLINVTFFFQHTNTTSHKDHLNEKIKNAYIGIIDKEIKRLEKEFQEL